MSINTIIFKRTDSTNQDFINLVISLDRYLSGINGEDDSFFKDFNKIEDLQYVIVVYLNGVPVGCGALKKYSSETLEVKRMFVEPAYRGRKIAQQIVAELELWAQELNYQFCILETSVDMKPAVALYKSVGYLEIPKYGPYKEVESSICFQKELSKN